MQLRPHFRASPWIASLALLAAGCGAGMGAAPGGAPEVAGTADTAALTAFEGPLVVAAGDISCEPGDDTSSTKCRDAETAKLAKSYEPRHVLGLGDLQYESGELSAFQSEYADTWGALKGITKPVPGNHEYDSDGASGYYDYFDGQQPGAPGYYAFDVGSWRVYALNTNCSDIDCDKQAAWLDEAMAGNPRKCTAITMHHPLYSSGEHGSQTEPEPMWESALTHGTDLALAGHDHHYERFRRMDASGNLADDGITSFVAGAGGRSLYDILSVEDGSAVRHNNTFGILALRLGKGRFAWEYKTIEGDVVDSGIRRCR